MIKHLNGRPLMVDQVPVIDGGRQVLSGGHGMTVGEALSTMLMQEKVPQFNALKAYALAQRFYKSDATDVDEGDLSALREMVEENKNFTPLVCAQVLQVLMDAKDQAEKKRK